VGQGIQRHLAAFAAVLSPSRRAVHACAASWQVVENRNAPYHIARRASQVAWSRIISRAPARKKKRGILGNIRLPPWQSGYGPAMRKILRRGWLTVFLLLAGCYTVAGNRPAVDDPGVAGEESAMGATAFADIQSKETVSNDPRAKRARAARRPAHRRGSGLRPAQCAMGVRVFDAPKTVNAFALPGGKVGVYSGLLNLATKRR